MWLSMSNRLLCLLLRRHRISRADTSGGRRPRSVRTHITPLPSLSSSHLFTGISDHNQFSATIDCQHNSTTFTSIASTPVGDADQRGQHRKSDVARVRSVADSPANQTRKRFEWRTHKLLQSLHTTRSQRFASFLECQQSFLGICLTANLVFADVPVVSSGMGIGVAEDLSYHTNGLTNGTIIKRKKGRKPKNLENINGNTNHCSTATKRKSREGVHCCPDNCLFVSLSY